ncbi:unnamed protein product [Lactuca saligna]|uniref:PB1-like domain-containing protein n=1 Tax=Lactuca saligna TaxID=75948 RepID=A0AA36A0W4_LACSI|nr:unnamed protein product [Lactuca saligna]
MSGWRIRLQMDGIDLEASYGGNPTIFSICLHYGGEFTKFLGRKYIKGQPKFVDLIDNDLFSVHDIDDMMEELGCVEEGKVMYYQFKRPLGDLDFRFFALGNDQDVNNLRIESPIEVESVKEPNMEPPIMEPFSEALGGSSDVEGSGDSSDSDDSDFIVAEDNLLDDPEVDMHDYYLNIDDNLKWVVNAPIKIENVVMSDEEMEVINTDVLQSDSSSDEGQMSKRRNKIRVAERAQINDATQVSDPFYILQTFSRSKEPKDIIYLHAIEIRRELDIVKNDKNKVRVVCKGTIPDMGILETSGKGGPSKTSGKGRPSQRNINGGPSQMGEKGGPSKKEKCSESR